MGDPAAVNDGAGRGLGAPQGMEGRRGGGGIGEGRGGVGRQWWQRGGDMRFGGPDRAWAKGGGGRLPEGGAEDEELGSQRFPVPVGRRR